MTEGLILATGAVVGNTEERVISRTLKEIGILSLPELTDRDLISNVEMVFKSGKGAIIDGDNEMVPLISSTTLDSLGEIEHYFKSHNIKTLILGGALTDSFVEKLIYSLGVKDCLLVVKDSTKVFLNRRNFNLLKKYKIKLNVYNSMKLIAVTVNPTSPYGIKLNSERIVHKLQDSLSNVPVYDVLGIGYSKIAKG